jgi:dihydrofolate synthase/folylpolyglutamate synthase
VKFTTRAERHALERLLHYGDPLRGPGWNPRSPPDPRLNVQRVRILLDAAASPDLAMTCVLAAGTKGKGSTAAFLASILAAAGVRAGLFTSPHLQSWRERIRVDGVAIRPAAFAESVEYALGHVPALWRAGPRLGDPSAFELLVVAALSHFARERCTVAVLEVGLGGRYDATNAVDPAISIVTSIGLDHVSILGGTLDRIALEKAGVMRARRPALLAQQAPRAARALARACRDVGAECRTVRPLGPAVKLGISGSHQRQNAALARAAALELRKAGHTIEDRAIGLGLRRVRWPARFEILRGRPTIVLDGAHTKESTAALAATIRRTFPGRRIRLVFGCTSDRDPSVVAGPLLRLSASIHATAATGPRAMPAKQVAAALDAAGAHARVGDALAEARTTASGGDVVCVTGSMALVGEARAALGLLIAERLWD